MLAHFGLGTILEPSLSTPISPAKECDLHQKNTSIPCSVGVIILPSQSETIGREPGSIPGMGAFVFCTLQRRVDFFSFLFV